MVNIFTVLALTELWVAVNGLIEANAVVLLALVAFAGAALPHQTALLDLLQLLQAALLSRLRVEVFAVSARAHRWPTFLCSLETNAVLFRASSVLASARLRFFSDLGRCFQCGALAGRDRSYSLRLRYLLFDCFAALILSHWPSGLVVFIFLH